MQALFEEQLISCIIIGQIYRVLARRCLCVTQSVRDSMFEEELLGRKKPDD